MYRPRRFANRQGYGRGRGGGSFGYGNRRRFQSPNCDWYPDRPRGWWFMPEFQEETSEIGWTAPPVGARWDPYSGTPETPEAIEYEISRMEKQIQYLNKELENLKKLKKAS